jgi:hypothetical protein
LLVGVPTPEIAEPQTTLDNAVRGDAIEGIFVTRGFGGRI